MNTKAFFAQATYLRKPEYVVLTELIEKNGKKYIQKSPIYPQGKAHIKNIYKNHGLIHSIFDSIALPNIEEKGDKVLIEYIDSPNLESEIEYFLMEGNIHRANEIVSQFVNFIKHIPSISYDVYNSSEFVDHFDPLKKHDLKRPVDCLQLGLYDTNIDNFIYKEGQYYFIDFEYLFKFQIPKDYLLLRAVYYTSVRLARLISALASPEFECANIFDNVLIPVDWLSPLKHSPKMFLQMLDYEKNILSKLIANYSNTHIETTINDYLTNPTVTYPISRDPTQFQETIGRINRISQSKKDAELAIAELQRQLDKLESGNQVLVKQLSDEKQTVKELQEVIAEKDILTPGLHSELETMNAKYDKKSFQILERIESTRFAQNRHLRIFLRNCVSVLVIEYRFLRNIKKKIFK